MKYKFIILSAILIIFITNFISAADVSYCCEKTKTGAWCQSEDSADKCDTSGDLKAQQTSCESTSYCKMGCCFNNREGTCSQNTAQKTCENDGGTWDKNADCNIEQCRPGCCILGNTAFWNTLTACKKYSNGLEINFRKDIAGEFECITLKDLEEKGACVYEENGVKTCKFITKKKCNNMKGIATTSNTPATENKGFFASLFGSKNNPSTAASTIINSVGFYEGFLCSADQLGTNCAKTQKTTCSDEKVYFVDTCNNTANIYDSAKINDTNYWAKTVKKEDSCSYGEGNANSKTCGNCDPYFGSTCKPYQRTADTKPQYGDNLCRDLSCIDETGTHKHGETWCAWNTKVSKKNAPGSESYVLSCFNGEIDYVSCETGSEGARNLICSQSKVGDYTSASCIANKNQDCVFQTEKDDCENSEIRDCKWVKTSNSGNLKLTKEYCVPSITPGFNFWSDSGTCTNFGTANEQTGTGIINCIVKREKGLLGTDCKENCDCERPDFQKKMAQVCTSIGDCELEVKVGNNATKEISP